MNERLNVYQGKRVLVTGHTGFKGSWLSLWLKQLGANVIGFALDPPSQPNAFSAIGLEKEITHVYGDIRNKNHLDEVFERHQPEFVFHLAAQPLVRLSYENPHLTYETNIMGTVNVLEAIRQTKTVRVAINITSDKCYENREWVWGYRENDPMGGHDPYSSSKGCAELITSAYMRSFFSPNDFGETHHTALASVRAGNVIGGGDWGRDRLVPDCMRSLSKGEEIVIRYPNAIRPWQHVLEPLSGYLSLGVCLWEDAPKYSGGWNFGPSGEEIWPVEKLTRTICELWGNGTYRVDENNHPHEASWLKLDCSKANTLLHWKPQFDVRTALEKTVAWYKRFYANASADEMKEFSLQQINEYDKTSIGTT